MLIGSFVALITPFLENGDVDYQSFASLVDWHISEGTDGLVICGTTGEGPTLLWQEQKELLKIAVERAKGRVCIVMGTGTNDTRSTCLRTKEAKELGADACLVIVPYYNKPSFEGCYKHFEKVSEANLPWILYHHPGRTGLKFSAKEIQSIISLPNANGIKDSSGDLELVSEVIRTCSTSVMCGDDLLTLPMMSLGAKGVISVVANVIPRQWKEFCRYALLGDWKNARALHQKFAPLCRALFLETNPQGIKYAVSVLGRCSSTLRLPLICPKEVVKRQIEEQIFSILELAKVSNS